MSIYPTWSKQKKHKFLLAPTFIFALIILAGLVLTVFQTRNSQDIRQRAMEPSGAEKPMGQALYYRFNGWNPPAENYVTIPDNYGEYSYNIDQAFSIEFWVQLDRVEGDEQDIVGNFGTPYNLNKWNYVFAVQKDNAGTQPNTVTPFITVRTNSGTVTAISPDYINDDGQTWYHLAATMTRTELKLYVNGVLKSVQTLPEPIIKYQTSELAIGSFLNETKNTTSFFGSIDELRISSVVRDISNNWSRGLYDKQLGVDSHTTGLWRFDGNLEDISIMSKQPVVHNSIEYADGKVPVISTDPTNNPRDSRVFVTSSNFNANFGGLAGADIICQGRADVAGLRGIWKAWLSDSQTSASQRLFHSNSGYYRLDGKKIANNWDDLTDGALENPVELNEFKQVKSNQFDTKSWSNTNADGSIFSNNINQTCRDWKSGVYTTGNAMAGKSQNRDTQWTSDGSEPCSVTNTAGLYCVEQVNIEDTRTPTPTLIPTPPYSTSFNKSLVPDLNSSLNSYVKLSSSQIYDLGLNSASRTVESWVKPYFQPNTQTQFACNVILDKSSTTGASTDYKLSLCWQEQADGQIKEWYSFGAVLSVNGIPSCPYIAVVSDNTKSKADVFKWHHIAGIVDSQNQNGLNVATVKLFVDGQLQKSVSYTGTPGCNGGGQDLFIGQSTGAPNENDVGNKFYGEIDEMRISNIARYNANFSPPTLPFENDGSTLALWHFDGTTVDSSGLGHQGVIMGNLKFIDSDLMLPTPIPTLLPTATPTEVPSPTLLPTATPTSIPTSTPTAMPTPTNTLTPTPTPAFPKVQNYSFEIDSDANLSPDKWTANRLTSADKLDTRYAQQGRYAFLFTPQVSGNTNRKTLTQSLYYATGQAGQTVALDVWHQAERSSGAVGSAGVILQLVYADGSTAQITTTFPKTQHTWQKSTTALTAVKPYRKINITLFNSNIYTNYWMDNLNLRLVN